MAKLLHPQNKQSSCGIGFQVQLNYNLILVLCLATVAFMKLNISNTAVSANDRLAFMDHSTGSVHTTSSRSSRISVNMLIHTDGIGPKRPYTKHIFGNILSVPSVCLWNYLGFVRFNKIDIFKSIIEQQIVTNMSTSLNIVHVPNIISWAQNENTLCGKQITSESWFIYHKISFVFHVLAFQWALMDVFWYEVHQLQNCQIWTPELFDAPRDID